VNRRKPYPIHSRQLFWPKRNKAGMKIVAGSLLMICAGALAAYAQTKQPARAVDPSRALNSASGYTPITGEQRLHWFAKSTLGKETLAAGVFTSAIGTARNAPHEYGPHWDGFGKRYGMRLTGTSTSNAMEGGLGALWGEDPRYFRRPDDPFKARVLNAVESTFMARRPDGHAGPAYARFLAIAGSNFLSNTWRADSEATNGHAAARTLYGILGRLGSDGFAEFWPDVKRLIRNKKGHQN
jgi:hypothetical protein